MVEEPGSHIEEPSLITPQGTHLKSNRFTGFYKLHIFHGFYRVCGIYGFHGFHGLHKFN